MGLLEPICEPVVLPQEQKVTVQVSVGDVAGNKKKYRLYHVCVSVPAKVDGECSILSHTWDLRYSSLLQADDILPEALQRKVPPRYVLFNYTTNLAHCSDRAKELTIYLTKMFRNEDVMRCKRYHRAIGLQNEAVSDALFALGHKQYATEFLEKEELEIKWMSAYTTTQNFLTSVEEGEMPILAFQDEIEFRIKVIHPLGIVGRWCAAIFGPDGREWLRVQDCYKWNREHPTLCLLTMSERPLAKLEPVFTILGNTSNITRLTANEKAEPWCDIEKHSGPDPVYLFHRISPHCPKIELQLSRGGRFNKYIMNGVETATVVRHLMPSTGELPLTSFDVTVKLMPHCDAILQLTLIALAEKMRLFRFSP